MKNNTFSRPQPGNRIKRSLLAFVSLGLGFASVAQTNITIGTGTASSSNVPLTTNYGYNYSQQIYYAADLIAQGVGQGQVNKIRFYTTSAAPTNNQNWTIYMSNTVKTEFTSTTNWEVMANMTQVFIGDVTFPATANNWMEITLTTPFQWDGVSNVLIAVDENTPNWSSTLSSWRTTTTAGVNRSIYYRNDSNNPDPNSPPTATGRVTAYPNLQLEMVPTIACAGTPAHANTVTSAANVCTAGNANLSLNTSYFNTGITYQWQKNEGSGWTDIPAANTTTYAATGLTLTTDYRAIVGCTNGATADTSAEVTVTVNPYPVVVIDLTDVATCNGEPANLTASGADTYLWSPTTLLTPSATSANVNVIPATTTTYTVTGTTAGCSSTATSKITPLSMVQGTPVYAPTENCTPGSPVTIQVTGLPATITSGGTWEYRWLASDSVTVLQDWSASDSYTFIPTEDSVYGHFYQLRSTSCPDNYIDSVYTSIVIGFGADVELTHYNCNTMGGTIALENPFGQTAVTELYSNPLSDLATMTEFTLSNNASVTAGRLQLTPSATGQTGYGQLTIPGFSAGLNNAMTVSFNMTADTPINTFGTGGADGIAYSFGDDATPAGNGTGHNGKGTKLRLSFDAAGNGSENNNQPGIYLVYGWTATNAFGPASAPQTLAYSPNTALWKIQTDIPVELSINTEGKATVTVNGTVVFSDIQLPPAYMTADVSNWKHLFSAGTGGDAMRQAVSNLAIEAGNLNYGIAPGNTVNPPSDWQASTSFEDLLPGTYDIWISKDTLATCLKKIGTYEILNTNPVVELGNDTTICEGDSLLLDAGNPGSVYTWSGSNTYTQTMEVSEEGSYIVYVTDPQGCLGIGTINVDVNEAPSATGIYAQGAFPTMFFSVTGAQNASDFDWNFGDGVTVNNGPGSISHVYATDGTFNVTVTLANDCGTATYSQSITITDVTGLGENTIEGLTVYPNPASDNVTVSLPNSETSGISVYNVSGSLVQSSADFNATTTVDVSQWQKGIYFLHITNQGKVSVTKLVVQ